VEFVKCGLLDKQYLNFNYETKTKQNLYAGMWEWCVGGCCC